MNLAGYRCVVIDDSRLMRRFMSALLEGAGAEVMALRTAKEGVAACEEMKPDLVVLDLKLPDNDGVNVLPIIKRVEPSPAVIISSVRHDPRTVETAFRCGADDYLPKPFLAGEALAMITKHAGRSASIHRLRS